MKTLLSPMVGAAMASFMLSAHADFIDDSHADVDRKSTRLNSSHSTSSRMPSSA